ncbi:MAG: oligosaccharide flippase family protein [Chloroflexi bacterium]|nr:oligosaccharide flippase family protein [Chloroflexota bacterium]
MRQTFKRFARLTASYSPVTLLGPIITILLTPLYTRVLDPADYGVVDVATTLFAAITSFVVLGMEGAINALFFDGDTAHQANLVTTGVIYIAVSGALIGSVVSFFATPLAQFFLKDPAYNTIIYLLSVNMISSSIYGIIAAALRLRMGVKHVNTLGLTYLFVTVASNVLFILILHFKAIGIVATVTVTNLVSCGMGLFLASKSLKGHFSRPLLKSLLKTGVGLLPSAISTFLLMSVDRLLLTQFVSQNDIGLYSIANKLGTMMFVLTNAAWSAWWPIALQMADSQDAPRQYARMFEYLLSGSMLLALTIGLFAPEILAVFTRIAYVPAAPYTQALLIYFGPISLAVSSFQIGLYVRKRTDWVGILVSVCAAINIALNLLLDPVIGVWGAVWATVGAGAILAITTYLVSRRAYAVNYNMTRILSLVAIYLCLVGVFLAIPVFNSLPYKAAALLLFMALLLFTGVVSTSQLQMGLEFVRHRLYRMTKGGSGIQ